MLQLKSGAVNCVIHTLFLQLAINTYGYAIFGLGEFPEWAMMVKKMTTANGTLLATTNFNDTDSSAFNLMEALNSTLIN